MNHSRFSFSTCSFILCLFGAVVTSSTIYDYTHNKQAKSRGTKQEEPIQEQKETVEGEEKSGVDEPELVPLNEMNEVDAQRDAKESHDVTNGTAEPEIAMNVNDSKMSNSGESNR